MNCVELAIRHAREQPNGLALWLPGGGGTTTSFGELYERAARIERNLIARGIKPGDAVLLVDGLTARLYATVIATLSLGASVMLVEPWMRVSAIDLSVERARPSLFICNWLGRAWGARVRSIRNISRWVSPAALEKGRAGALVVEPVDPDVAGVLTFTSGTTGVPKGVVRSHEYLVQQHRVLSRRLALDQHRGTDLCIFANFVLANLASGRGSVLIPPKWQRRHLAALDGLPRELRPESLTCGPGFLLRLMESARAASLRAIHVGGALTDCWIYEAGFERWPDARWSSVYGSTEAEPVAVCDAREAVERSGAGGYFQTLYLGHPVPEIDSEIREDGLWVSGPHVCPLYLGDVEENRTHKRRDERGRVWHAMGDRVRVDAGARDGWWYAGRTSQSQADFELEQSIYATLRSSKAFVHRTDDGSTVLVGEDVHRLEGKIAGIDRCVDARVRRDSRHRARIDRKATLEHARL